LIAVSSILALASLVLSLVAVRRSPLSTLHYGLYLATQLIFAYLTYFNHHTSRTSANLVLVFWPVYALVSAVRIRTMILTGDFSSELSQSRLGRIILAGEALWLASAGFGLIDFLLELYSPEKRWRRLRWRTPWSKEGKIGLDEDEDDEAEDEVVGLCGGASKNEYGDVESPVLTANIYER
jgi:hypothetical protein